jgi:hypothetical protein
MCNKNSIGLYLRHTDDNREIVIWFSQVHEFFLRENQTGSESQIASYSIRTVCFISAANVART